MHDTLLYELEEALKRITEHNKKAAEGEAGANPGYIRHLLKTATVTLQSMEEPLEGLEPIYHLYLSTLHVPTFLSCKR